MEENELLIENLSGEFPKITYAGDMRFRNYKTE